MKKITLLASLPLLLIGQVYAQAKQKKDVMNNTEQTDHYTFQLSDQVNRKAVTFKNRYGITVSADLYTPKNIGNQKIAAIIVSGPFGAVKEQSSGLYANELASRGFVTLAFDPSFTGESG